MHIDLFWSNINTDQTTLEIFRDDEWITPEALDELEPIATFTEGEEEFRDTDVIAGNIYYYVFVNSNGDDRTISTNHIIEAVNLRGIGPQQPIDGDLTLGYIGSVDSTRLINTQELVTTLGMDGVTISNPLPTWHKFVRNNKILWIPNTPIASNVGYNWLYQQGLVHGVDAEGTNPFNSGTQQMRTIKLGLDTYIVRLMTGIKDGDWDDLDLVGYYDNEFSDLVFPLMHTVPPTQRLNNITLNGQYIRDVFGNSTAHKILVQEPLNATTAITRGYGSNVYDYQSDYTSWYEGRSYNTPRATRNGNHLWWPVLELVEED